ARDDHKQPGSQTRLNRPDPQRVERSDRRKIIRPNPFECAAYAERPRSVLELAPFSTKEFPYPPTGCRPLNCSTAPNFGGRLSRLFCHQPRQIVRTKNEKD